MEALESLRSVLRAQGEGLVVRIPEDQHLDFSKAVREDGEADEQDDRLEESRKLR